MPENHSDRNAELDRHLKNQADADKLYRMSAEKWTEKKAALESRAAELRAELSEVESQLAHVASNVEESDEAIEHVKTLSKMFYDTSAAEVQQRAVDDITAERGEGATSFGQESETADEPK